MRFSLPRGMRDIEPDEFELQEKIRSSFLEVTHLFGFKVMEPSPMEALGTLEAKSGPAIQEEIYFFRDKGGRDIGLRFDLTVGMTRYVTSRRDLTLPVRLGSFSNMWRYDEPQYGRYRWLHQWDVEIFGPTDVAADAEVIDFTSTLMNKIGLEKVSIHVGDRRIVEQYIRETLGINEESTVIEMLRAVDKVGKKTTNEIVVEYEEKGIKPDSTRKLISFGETKGEAEKTLADIEQMGLTKTQPLKDLIDSLTARKISNVLLNMGVVRGIDYYTGIVFEVFGGKDAKLGALAGGGRYDGLPALFGRPDMGATGVAGGVERTALALSRKSGERRPIDKVFIANTNNDLKAEASRIAATLRAEGISCELELSGRTLRKQLEAASHKSFRIVVIVAPRELSMGKVVLKDMDSGKEMTVPAISLASDIRSRLG